MRKALQSAMGKEPSEPLRLRSAEERKEILKKFVVKKVAQGFRVELQDDFTAVLAFGKSANHILHLLLSVITFGVWILVWLVMIFVGNEKRYLYEIDEYGVITKK